jgi:hypothetical protein
MSVALPAMTAHELLLRLAGRLPDHLVIDARRLAGDDIRAAMSQLIRWLAAEPVPLLAAELAAIRALSGYPAALSGTRPVKVLPEPPFVFDEADPSGDIGRDRMDDAVAAVAEGYGVGAVWRSWRYRLDDPDAGSGAATVTVDPDDPDQSYRVYIVQVEQTSQSQSLYRDLARAVDDTGRAGVEVILPGDEPPLYQRLALASSMLLWAREDEPEFDLAAVFDFASPASEPGFAAGHTMIADQDEREQVLSYLRSGALVLTTTARTPDILDPAAGAVVPANFRTDGEWIWTDAAGYYLSRYGLAPHGRLHEHIRRKLSRGEFVTQVDSETVGRAADFLLSGSSVVAEEAV